MRLALQVVKREMVVPIPRSLARSGWDVWHIIAGGLVLALGLVLTHRAWADIWQIALHDAGSRYLLLPPLAAAFLIWVRRSRLVLCRPVGSWFGPAAVAVGWALFWWGEGSGMVMAWHAGALLIVVGCALAVAGRDVLYRFGPAVAVLVFLVPLPVGLREQLEQPLHRGMTELSWTLYHALGVSPVGGEGVLEGSGATAAVARACSGIRVILALALLSYAFAFSRPLRAWVRALILIFTPVAAVLGSAVGLVVTTWLLGQSLHEQVRVLEASGWIIVISALLVLLGILRLLTWAAVPVRPFNLASQR